MPTPTVWFRVLSEGYRIETDPGGIKATVPYLVDWENAFVFHDQVLGYSNASSVGPITRSIPYVFPGAPGARLYASKASIEPIGNDGGPLPANHGLAAGEHFLFARITVTFEASGMQQDSADDPANLNQLDPANPITYCDQSVESGGKMETRPAAGYEFDDGKPVIGDVGVIEVESRLVLSFPKVPYLPWQLVKGYLGSLNDVATLQCPRGTLLFESFDTKFSPTSQGIRSQQLQLKFAHRDLDWNMLPRSNGVFDLVRKVGATSERIYPYMDIRELFLDSVVT